MTYDTTLPGFAFARATCDRYAVERESRPDHDGGEGERLRIRDVEGTPSTLMILVCVRRANAEGWLLDDHTDHGEQLVFVPVEGGES